MCLACGSFEPFKVVFSWFSCFLPFELFISKWKIEVDFDLIKMARFFSFVCVCVWVWVWCVRAVRWAAHTQRWIWTRKACCQIVSAENDPSPSVDPSLVADALTKIQTLPHTAPRRRSSKREPRSPRTGVLLNVNKADSPQKNSMDALWKPLTFPGELLCFAFSSNFTAYTWEQDLCVARKPGTEEAERPGSNSQPEPLGGASEQSHNGTRPKRCSHETPNQALLIMLLQKSLCEGNS